MSYSGPDSPIWEPPPEPPEPGSEQPQYRPPYDPPPWGAAPPEAPPGYGPGDGELPPQEPSNSVKVALFAVLGVLVLVVAVVAAILFTGDNGTPTAKGVAGGKTTPAPVPSSNDFPSASPSTTEAPSSAASPSGPVPRPPKVPEARAVVERYFLDINSRNETEAVTLICTDKRPAWRSSIHGPTGDFTVTITKYSFTSSRPGPNGSIDLTYTVTATKGAASGTRPATFTLVSESDGPKICSES